jgi:hypothetical protein
MTTVQRLRASSSWLFALSVAIAIGAGGVVSAHRLDEYLQAARIDLLPDGVTIDLHVTPGAEVADSILATVDRDGNGITSVEEQNAYAEYVLGALETRVDGTPLRLQLQSAVFSRPEEFRRGEGMIRLRVSGRHLPLPAGRHQLFFANRHLGRQSVYLANALVPGNNSVSVLQQRRTFDQSALTIEYSVGASLAGFSSNGILLGLVAVALIARYTRRNGARS